MDIKWASTYEAEKRLIPTGETRPNGKPKMMPVYRRAIILTEESSGTRLRFAVSKTKDGWRFHDPRHKTSGLKGSASLTTRQFLGAVENMIGLPAAVQLVAKIS